MSKTPRQKQQAARSRLHKHARLQEGLPKSPKSAERRLLNIFSGDGLTCHHEYPRR
jgi:hypothetical protein